MNITKMSCNVTRGSLQQKDQVEKFFIKQLQYTRGPKLNIRGSCLLN